METSVLVQGLPPPRNLEAAAAMADAVRGAGAEPAWIWVDGGAVRVGATLDELRGLAATEGVAKVARRDLPLAVASGAPGATTVSATLWAAHRAGIEVMATGGIGGVHLGSGDVSADLAELSRTAGTVVCAGPKSIVDAAATMERLEELGVAVIGYRCDRLPFFLVRESGVAIEHRADDPAAVARMGSARRELGAESALVVCRPIDPADALDPAETAALVDGCVAEARRRGVTGKAVTPFLLSLMAERSGGRTLEANLSLLRANADLAGQVAAVPA
jgi:pseudouridine-5'-phosphate glycosidase